MKIKTFSYIAIFVLALTASLQAKVQSVDLFDKIAVTKITAGSFDPDSIDAKILSVDSTDLQKIVGLRAVFESQNKMYNTPKPPGQALLRRLGKDRPEISTEAKYWARMARDTSHYFNSHVTFRDTVIVDPMYLPIVFREESFTDEELTFYSKDVAKSKFAKPELYRTDSIFEDYRRKKASSDTAINYVIRKHPSYVRYSKRQMPQEVMQAKAIRMSTPEDIQIKVENEADFSDVTPVKFIPEIRYWTSGFESAIQLSQNYVSENWHKGGNSYLNLFTKNALIYNYAKDKIKIVNELEHTTSIYTATEDTCHSYKVSNDVLRIHNNVGFRAFSKWSYTFDTELRTQILQSHKENTEIVQSAFLAPFTATFGIGMKYDLSKQFTSNKHKKLSLAINLAPLSFTYMYSRLKDPEKADMGRHGFLIDEETGMYDNSFSDLGSNIKANMTFNVNRNVTWQSRLDYLTSYKNVKMEFENTLTLAINRFFSTRIYVHLRYDDSSAAKDPDLGYFQLNELLSFGFNYRW